MEPNPHFWAGKRVCVTGGTGFLGYQLVCQLLELGAHVSILALPPADSHPIRRRADVAKVFGDLRDLALVRRTLADCDVIFHTAAIVAVWGPPLQDMDDVNVMGTRNVLTAAPRQACVVHTSSIVAVGATRTGTPLTEDSVFNLDDVQVDYIHTKRAAEQEALKAAARGLRVVVTNPGYMVGPEDHERSVMSKCCIRFWRGRIPLAPPGGLNLVDVRDVARGHVLAAEHGQSGRRYILGGENLTMRAFLYLLAEVGHLRPRTIPPLPQWAQLLLACLGETRAWLTGRPPYPAFQHVRMNRFCWFCRSDRAQSELGYQCRPLSECLADTHCWYAARKKLSLRGLNQWWMRPEQPCTHAA